MAPGNASSPKPAVTPPSNSKPSAEPQSPFSFAAAVSASQSQPPRARPAGTSRDPSPGEFADEITPLSREVSSGGRRNYNTSDNTAPLSQALGSRDGAESHAGAANGSSQSQQAQNGGGAGAALAAVARQRKPSRKVKTRGRTAARDGQGGEESEGEESGGWSHWWHTIVDKYGSVELDNKGATARDHLALERTFLAWLRTSLAFASIGIAITQLFRLNTTINNREGLNPVPDTNPNDIHLRQIGKPLGATFLGIAILVLITGGRRYFEGQYWIIRGKFPASRGSVVLVTTVAALLIVTSLVVVITVAPTQFVEGGTGSGGDGG